MPIGAITMILTNVGLQIFNNWCSSRQNGLLQQKREDFEKAARERNTQRMWQLMREGQEITRQLEEEKHEQRLEELKNDIESLLKKLAYSAAIGNWPLNVLPIVMKNQALGNLIANQDERIALHCIFTPSNSADFNRLVFPNVESTLEDYCNKYWSVMSDHPILFYSGAWKTQQSPTEVQIDSMRTALNNMPTLVITPFFRPNDGKLVFHVRIWGVGTLSSDEFSIPEIVPKDFQREYSVLDKYDDGKELLDDIIEDIVPYLQCLIGYIADTLYWSSLFKAPHLPALLANGAIDTDGMKYLINDSRQYYDKLLLATETEAKKNPFIQTNILTLCKGCSWLWDEKYKRDKLNEIEHKYISSDVINSIPILYPIEDFDISMYQEKRFETLDVLNDVLIFLHERLPETGQNNLYLLLSRSEDGLLTSNIIDEQNTIHILSPSADFKFYFTKLYKARKIKEYFGGKREKLIPVDNIADDINRLKKIYESSVLTY